MSSCNIGNIITVFFLQWISCNHSFQFFPHKVNIFFTVPFGLTTKTLHAQNFVLVCRVEKLF